MPRWSQRSHTDQVCTPNKRVKHDGTKLEEIIALTTVDGERQVKARWEGGSISWYPLAAIVAPHDIFFDSLTEQINKFNKKLAKKDKTIKELNKKITEYEKLVDEMAQCDATITLNARLEALEAAHRLVQVDVQQLSLVMDRIEPESPVF